MLVTGRLISYVLATGLFFSPALTLPVVAQLEGLRTGGSGPAQSTSAGGLGRALDGITGDGEETVDAETNDSTEEATEPASTIAKWFPEEFREQKHFVLYDYQWIGLLALIFLGFAVDRVTRWALSSLTKTWLKLVREKDAETAKWKLWRPLGLLTQALVWYAGTGLLGLPDLVQTLLLYGLKLFAIISAVWTAFLAIDLIAVFLGQKARLTETKFDDLLIPLISKSLKVFAVCVGVITCAQTFNLPLAGLLGGLGIGGAAIAFASKDAIANLFGSVTVLTDRPFEIGDWIKTEGIEGTVEAVGFRSSRIRTFYNSLITLPNSRLTTAVVDNMGQRSYRRITATLGIQYDTRPDQIDAFCEGVRELIRRHPYTRKDYYHVYLNGFGANALDIMLYCFVACPDWSVELREKHRLYLDIIKLATGLGISFAFPTRTVHLHREQAHSQDVATELNPPEVAGQRLAAGIAGPLLSPTDRPGNVEFRGPSSLDDDIRP